MGGQECEPALAAGGLAHLAPERDGRFRVVAPAGGHFQADEVGFRLVAAAELERDQLRAEVRGRVAQVAQAQQLRAERQAHARGLRLGQAGAGVLAQCMGHLVAHDHGGLVIGELELVQDAGVEGDLAARHAEGVDLFAADQVDLPFPLPRAVVPLGGEGNEALADAAQAHQLGMCVAGQGALGLGLGEHLIVLLVGGGLQLLGRHEAPHLRGGAHIHLGQRRGRGRRAGRQQEAAPRIPGTGAQGVAEAAAGVGMRRGRWRPIDGRERGSRVIIRHDGASLVRHAAARL